MATRREVLAAAVATVTLPMLDSALGGCSRAQSVTATAPATGSAPARGANTPAPDEKAGWFASTIKPADVKDGEFTLVEGHGVVLARTGKEITALSNKCTHRGCAMPPKAGANVLTCPCHGSQFKMDGSVAKTPATTAVPHFAIRLSAAGVIEIDPGQKPKAEDKEFKITIA